MRGGQLVIVRVAGFGGLRNAGPAGIGQPQGAGNFIKRFARSVIHRAAQNMVLAPVLYLHNMAVAAAGHQAEKWRLQLWVGQIVGCNVPAQVMYRHQRLARAVSQALGKVDPHQHGPNKAGGKGDGHRVHIRNGHVGILQSLLHRCADVFRMAAAGNFWHNTAVKRLFFDAGRNNVGN